MKHFYSVVLALFFLPVVCNAQKILVTGRMTNSGEEGINIYNFNSSDAGLSLLSKADAGPNPSFFCFSEKNNLIYAVNEVSRFNGKKGGGITTLRYNEDFTKITKVNEISVPNGSPCYISISPDNNFLFVANYTGGTVAVYKLDKDGIPESICDTILFKDKDRKVSHPHMISFDPAGNRIYLTDLGLDRIMIYSFDKATGKLNSLFENGISLPDGTGPRHFVFNNSGEKMYVMGELKSTMTVFDVSEKDGLVLRQSVSALIETFKGSNYSADIHIDKAGEFLYGSNRGDNSIVTFRIGKEGLLTVAGHSDCGGDWPRNFTIDPSGKYIFVGNQKSGNIVVFGIDPKTGIPSRSMQNLKLNAPVCLKFIDK
jgi:6-phosphogluconolactonase